MALDITLDPAELAIIPSTQVGGPSESDWIAATWTRVAPATALTQINRLTREIWFVKVTASVVNELGVIETDSAFLQVLVGPGGTIALPAEASKVDVYSRVHDVTEVPVQKHTTTSIIVVAA